MADYSDDRPHASLVRAQRRREKIDALVEAIEIITITWYDGSACSVCGSRIQNGVGPAKLHRDFHRSIWEATIPRA